MRSVTNSSWIHQNLKPFCPVILFLLLIIQGSTIYGQAGVGALLPEQLIGEWYSQKGGVFQFGMYERGVVYKNQFWQYTAINKSHKKLNLLLKNDLGQTTKLRLQIKKHRVKFYPLRGHAIQCLNDLGQCKIYHNLPVIKNPQFTHDSIYVNYFLLSPNNEQISVTEHQLITGVTRTHYMAVDKNGMLHMAIAVTNPVLLEIKLPYRSKTLEKVFMLPGSNITLLQTHGDIHYGGNAALLAQQLARLFKRQNYGPEMDPLRYLLTDTNRTNNKPTSTYYGQYITRIQQKQQAYIDALLKAKKISPLAHQIDSYNIRYAMANARLHYTDYTNQLWKPNNLSATQTNKQANLPPGYFDFLKPLDDDHAIIAPAYWDFIQSMRSPNSKADFPPLNAPAIASEPEISIDTLCALLLPLSHLWHPLTLEAFNMLKNYQSLTDKYKQKAYINNHKDQIKALSKKYYSIYLYNFLTHYITHYFTSKSGWKPGITMDLLTAGNIILQLNGPAQQHMPADYLSGPMTKFHDKFIGETLNQYYQQNQTTQTANQSVINNSQQVNKNRTANKINDSQQAWVNIIKSDFVTCDTIRDKGLTLIFANNDPKFEQRIKDSLIRTFFSVYPKQMAAYNPRSTKKVFIVIDSACPALAATVENVIRIQPKWFETNPNDFDVVTHEAMHIVQHYVLNGYQPRWLTEGIADYVRQIYGLHNQLTGWHLTPFANGMHYTNGYRITARFLYWITQKKEKNFVKKVDKALRENTYGNAFWQKNTGKSLDALWQEYSENPTIQINQNPI